MDTHDRAQLHAHLTELEHELLTIEQRMLAAGDVERLQLAAGQESLLADLGAVNARLSTLRNAAAAP